MSEGFGFTGFLKENYIFLVALDGILIIGINTERDSAEKRAVSICVTGLVAVAVMQYVERWLGFLPEPTVWRSILSAVVYAVYPFLLLILLWSVDDKAHRLWIPLPAVLNAACCVADLFGADLIFHINEDNHYMRGMLRWLPFAVTGVYLVFFVSFTLGRFWKENHTICFIFVYIAISICVSVFLEMNEIVRSVNAVGMLDILMYQFYLTIGGRFEEENKLLAGENVRLAGEKALTESKAELLQQQIHRHFIYNSMVALKSLCRRDPAKAEAFVQDLSDYLRVNLESMTRERFVPFSKESEYIRRYLAIEQVDPTSRFRVEWKIGTDDFILPALSVEPLVENAVQHGVADADINGYIRISTREEERSYLIEVEDNGLGIQRGEAAGQLAEGGTGKETAPVKRGVGLENTRLRLAAIGGRLTISSDEYGTIARVEVPKELTQNKR